jgi:hypothetical protein
MARAVDVTARAALAAALGLALGAIMPRPDITVSAPVTLEAGR